MANKKRDRNGYEKQFGRYRLNRIDLLTIEKMLREYADSREMKHAGVTKLPEGRKHMPRAIVDRYASVGKYSPFYVTIGWGEYGIHYPGVNWIYHEDSITLLSGRHHLTHTSYLEIAAWPGIKVTFTPLSTTIYAQTHYATGNELMVMRKVIRAVEDYLSKLPISLFNKCNLSAK